jgi:hypothetical protein
MLISTMVMTAVSRLRTLGPMSVLRDYLAESRKRYVAYTNEHRPAPVRSRRGLFFWPMYAATMSDTESSSRVYYLVVFLLLVLTVLLAIGYEHSPAASTNPASPVLGGGILDAVVAN